MFLQKAHRIWKNHLKHGGIVIDATCGNGHDTYILSQTPINQLFAVDIQQSALDHTHKRIGQDSRISYHLCCHSCLNFTSGPVDLIVYNLGYLPGGNESLTTTKATTLQSIQNGLNLLTPYTGLISCMLYPGHLEGSIEKDALLSFGSKLSSKKFQVTHYQHLNRNNAPSLLLIKKIKP